MDRDRLDELHSAILRGDAEARETVSACLLQFVQRAVRSRYPCVDPGIINDAAEDAVLKYLHEPLRYDPNRGSLHRFVTSVALNRAVDLLRRAKRSRERQALLAEQTLGHISLQQDCPRQAEPVLGGCDVLFESETSKPSLWAKIADSQVSLTPVERRFLEARLNGEHRTEVLAAILKLGDRPRQEQKRTVKRMKDALRLRIRRFAQRHGNLRTALIRG